MHGIYLLNTTLTIRNLQNHAKAQEIIHEIRDRFGEKVVQTANNLVVIKHCAHLDISSVARLDALVGRLGDIAAYGALITTSFNGFPHALRFIGPNLDEITTTRNTCAAKILSFERERLRLAMRGGECYVS